MGSGCERMENSRCSCLELNDGSVPVLQNTKLYLNLEKISMIFSSISFT